MTQDEMKIFLGSENMSIVEAMQMIDKNARGILFIVSEGKLRGTVTDGDIRRCLMARADLTIKVSEFMNDSPKFLKYRNRKQAMKYMEQWTIQAIPIVADNMEIMDIVFAHEKNNITLENNSLKDCPVVIMAGGKGTRLYPYTKVLPKPLIPIGDVPIIERIINRLTEYGTEEFFITVNYKKGMIKSYFEDIKHSYTVKFVDEDIPLGTAGSLSLIERRFEQPFIVTNCDVLIHAEYDQILDFHKQSGNTLTMVSALKNITVPYGVIHSKGQGIVTSLEEKPKLSYFVNTGMYILNPECFEYIPEDTFFHMTDLIDKLLKEGKQVGTYPISEDSFLDMGEFEEMDRMEQKLNIKSE